MRRCDQPTAGTVSQPLVSSVKRKYSGWTAPLRLRQSDPLRAVPGALRLRKNGWRSATFACPRWPDENGRGRLPPVGPAADGHPRLQLDTREPWVMTTARHAANVKGE